MNRLEKLKDLEMRLEVAMNGADPKTLPGLARQYRETIKEIEEIEGVDESDEISDILNGVSGANGPDLTELSSE